MKKNRIILTIFFVLTVVLFFITSAAPNLTGALQKTEVLEYGGLQVSDMVTCYIVRDETVYLASRSGDIEYYIKEGEQLRKGVRILDVNSNNAVEGKSQFSGILNISKATNVPYGIPTSDFVSGFNGCVSYFLDGYESILSPETILKVTREQMEKNTYKSENVVRKSTVTGDPMYKLIDDNTWYALYWVSTEKVTKYKVGNEISINLPLGQVKGKVSAVVPDGEDWRIVLCFNRYYEEFAHIRKIDAEVITADDKGLIVSNESIGAENGQAGLYVKDVTGQYVFKPVKVLTTDGKFSLVAVSYYYTDEGERVDTVNVYDEVLKKPK